MAIKDSDENGARHVGTFRSLSNLHFDSYKMPSVTNETHIMGLPEFKLLNLAATRKLVESCKIGPLGWHIPSETLQRILLERAKQ